MTTSLANRLAAWVPATLLIAGSLAFILGGSRHPHVNPTTMGPLGTNEFYRHFAHTVLSTPGWQAFHTLILIGPVAWALAAAAVVRLFGERGTALAEVGRHALGIGAVLWALAFVLDGYVAPRYAQAVISADASSAASAVATFSANAFTMARIGMISIVLIGIAVLSLAAALLLETRARSWSGIVGAAGLFVGSWPVVAALSGEFYPGPFTSVYWTATALAIGLWFLLLGTTFVRPWKAGADR